MKFTDNFDQTVVARYEHALTVRSVLHTMNGDTQKLQPFKSDEMSIIQYRILEIATCSDIGTNYTNVHQTILHHIKQAKFRIAGSIRNWSPPNSANGVSGLHQVAIQTILSCRERIEPALFGIELELDRNQLARAEYENFEARAINAFKEIFLDYGGQSKNKSRIRKIQVESVCSVLKEFEVNLDSWTDELFASFGYEIHREW